MMTLCTWTRKPTPEPTRFDDPDNWDNLPQDGDSIVFPAWPENLVLTATSLVLDTMKVYGPNSRGVIGGSINCGTPGTLTFTPLGAPAERQK